MISVFQTGENNLRKLKAIFGKQYIQTVQSLSVGEFLTKEGRETYILKVPLFQSQRRPIEFRTPVPQIEESQIPTVPVNYNTVMRKFSLGYWVKIVLAAIVLYVLFSGL